MTVSMFVPARGEQSLFLLRTCGVGHKLGFQVLEIPDAVVHSTAVAIDQPTSSGESIAEWRPLACA